MNYEDIKQIPVTDVVFRDDLYPRIERDSRLIQQYSENLEVMPPIELNQHNELIDGFHRWKAHQTAGLEAVPAIITHTESEAAFLRLACERNAHHGYQLKPADKQHMARRMYRMAGSRKEREELKKELPQVLSVAFSTLRGWVSEIDKDIRAEQKSRAFDLWLACLTQEQIAEAVNVPRVTITDWVKNFVEIANLSKSDKVAAEFMDFDTELYAVWTWGKKSNEVSHPGNSEQAILENLLYAYTEPFDVVVDPFAGGGSTIDVCRARFRRYHASDLTPIVSRENEIRQNNLVEQLPDLPQWKDVSLVFLDPPYWKQVEGKYSDSPSDLANMELDDFHQALAGIINRFASKLHPGAKIAMLMQSTQWNAPGRATAHHLFAILPEIDLPVLAEIDCPYQTQQATPQMVEWAKQTKKWLVNNRHLIIWEVH